MATYLLGLWAPNLHELYKCPYKPVGVVVRDGDDVALKVIGCSQLPEDYKPSSEMGKIVWDRIVDIFKERKEHSTWPTNLYFMKYNLELPGNLDEKVSAFYEQFVAPGFRQ
jgi:hypothetical protein